ncbi:MAG: electron transfer flavoprotein subunit alpha/FixB family protein [Candidatus Rokubacteria bacterium]|nr:electron transfer flavoprotein subunit alpha/FixB family protein [Candidatus Rokubacteria bacterium]
MLNDVAVVLEHMEGVLAEVSFEMLAKGRELARASGGRLVAVLPGHGVRNLVDELGAADVVTLVEHEALAHYTPEAYVRALAAALTALEPRAALVASSSMGLDQAGALSVRLGWPLCAYCRDAHLDGDGLSAVSQIYGGKLLAEAVVQGAHAICAMLPGAAQAAEGRAPGTPAVEMISPPDLVALPVRFKRLIRPEAGDVDITRESVLVSVGRGIQSQDNIPLLEELAHALGGALSASRPIVDQGWLPKTRQVGKSGLSVKPKLYVAVGISGAPEHIEGMRGAELILAINTDPGAPIFDVAHYGVVSDLFDVLPLLTEKIKSRA